MNKQVICILTQSHLCRNPRVLKEAAALSVSGYDVHILNAVSSKALLQQDTELIRDYPSIQLRGVADLSQKNLRSLADRITYKLGRLLVRYLKIQTPLALGYGALRYLRCSRKISAALYICHQELGSYTGTQLLDLKYNVAFDLEDWYSEDLLPDARRERPILLLRKIERTALHRGRFCTTTSNALAEKLASVYGGRTPETIYNVFPVSPGFTPREKSFQAPLKLFWFSQTIGPGRGLEAFIDQLNHIETALSLNLLGAIGSPYRAHLAGLLSPRHTISFHDLVQEPALAEKIAEFDIGLALEQTVPPSRNFTVTNKFFQYLQSGLPVIATETAGQKEIFYQEKPGIMLPQAALAQDIARLAEWLNDPAGLSAAQAAALSARSHFTWTKESCKLLKLVTDAIDAQN